MLLGDGARPLMALPALDTMAARWQLGIVDHAMVGSDIRLEDGRNYLPKPYLSAKLTTMLHQALHPEVETAKAS